MNTSITKHMPLEKIRWMKGWADWDRLRKVGRHVGPAKLDAGRPTTELALPGPEKTIPLRLDADVPEFFRSRGKG